MEYQKHPIQRNYRCYQCSAEYQAKKFIELSKRYCSSTCRQKAHRAKKPNVKVENRFARLAKNTFWLWVIRECRKAGSVQILTGHTSETLLGLNLLSNAMYNCYGWSRDQKTNLFNICHIQPRKGRDGYVGLLHPANLFIGCSSMNRKQSNKPVPADAGLRIPGNALKRKWAVDQGDTDATIAKLIRAFLGKVLDEHLAQLPVDLDKRHELAQRIYNRQQKGTAIRTLDHHWTLSELESREVKIESLEQMDAYQRGKPAANQFQPEVYARASFCVYADELGRVAATSYGRHKENCQEMLRLVRVLGIYLAQTEDSTRREHSSFFKPVNATWQPLRHVQWRHFWGKSPQSAFDEDLRFLGDEVLKYTFNALQGLHVPKEMLRARVMKRLHLNTLVPVIDIPERWAWEACGASWDAFIANLYRSFEATWQSLLDAGICTADEIAAARTGVLKSLHIAIEKGRQQYKNLPRFKRFYCGKYYSEWGFKGYPAYLEYPPVSMLPTTPSNVRLVA